MDVRKAALKALIKIIEKNDSFDKILNFYSGKVLVSSELSGLLTGTIRNKLTIDFFIQNISTRKLKDLSYQVRNALRLAIFELEFLKTHDYAVLNSYVEIVKQYDKKEGAFVNGVLRNFIRKNSEISFPEIEENPVYAISVKYSHPEWLIKKWIHNYGIDETIKICKYNNLSPKLVIRVNTLKISKQELANFLKKHDVHFFDDRIVNDCLVIYHYGSVKEIPGFKEGYWIVQSESSCLVSIVLDPQKNEEILDLCAAPGGKTTHIAALMSNKGKIKAIDINPERLIKLKDNCKRLGADLVEIETADALKYKTKEKFDRILIDTPCSNTGVFARRADARWKKSPSDIENLAKLQLEILNNAANFIKPGGIIVYSTCSIEPEENQEVIRKFLEYRKDFKPDKIAPYLTWEIDEDKGYFQILQSRQNIDGFFIARLRFV
ncbi:MAG: 16S rRNA (cytosine(967)-C(5))-methyltransferase RsmB [bacterium]